VYMFGGQLAEAQEDARAGTHRSLLRKVIP
jgi:hypothetical protein